MSIQKNNIEFSRLILGLWRLPNWSAKESVKLLHKAIELGIDTIDQADIYGDYKSQSYLGKAFKEDASLRKKFKLVSKAGINLQNRPGSNYKIGFYDTSHKHIMDSVNQSLVDLNTEYLDALLIHRPDPLMNPEELNETFYTLKKQGKVLNFGVSNFTPSQFSMLQSYLDEPLITNQVEVSVLKTDLLFDGTLDQCIANKTQTMVWSPLAGGSIFTGKDEQALRVRETLNQVAKEVGDVGIDQVAMAWLLKHPAKLKPILGTMKTERLRSAIDSLKIELSNEQWFRILVSSQGHPVP